MSALKSLTFSAFLLAIVTFTPTAMADPPTREQTEFFESKVRPILVENCYQCHSVDAEEIEAGLVLDSKWGWETGGDSGAAITPGDLDQSLLINAVRYNESVVSGMPPKSKLPANQIEILEAWVKMGAPDPRLKATPHSESSITAFDLNQRLQDHWSWRPITPYDPPPVNDTAWPISAIDRFILSKIEQARLRPAAAADKRTWLRRVYFDLIGLPPSREQTNRFLENDSADAYEQVVIELLQSPQFGEKWARHWMDLVRYADTYGHEFDYELSDAYEYRDYLIRALNADVPFNQFIREHIAGDLISEPRRHPSDGWNESILGTGFWYFHEATHAPTDVLGNEADIVDNQIDVFGKAFFGLTVACARCHDHKFDAISTADYYALSAYIQSSCRQKTLIDAEQNFETTTQRIDQFREQAATQLTKIDSEVEKRLRPGPYYEVATELLERASEQNDANKVLPKWIEEASSKHGLESPRLQRWVENANDLAEIIKPVQLDPKNQSSLFADFDSGSLPDGWSTSGLAFHNIGSETSVSVDGHMPHAGSIDSGVAGKKQVGILRSPTFEITTNQIHVRMKASANITVQVIIDNYQMAVFNKLLFNGTFLNGKQTDTERKWAWKTLGGDLKKYKGHKAYLEFVDNSEATIAIDEIRFSDGPPPDHPTENAAHSKTGAMLADELWRIGLRDLRQGRSNRFISWMLNTGLLTIDEISPDAAKSLAQTATLAQQLPAPRFAVAMAQGTPEEAHVYIRGSHTNLGEQVPARFLEALDGKPASRLELADRVASPDNPLTARVIVNRLWHHLLGRGIVPTVDDFGPQGEPPSHPELLDWLAHDFVANGWSLKHTIREIVLSQTYRQDSVANVDSDPEQIATVDPTNTLLHCMRVRRLPSESIRDAVLAVSGRLNPAQFGPGVPTYRTPFMTGRGARESGPLDGDGRRSIYLTIYRNFLNPFMLTFDMPGPFGPQGRRSLSNVPAQALMLMNDPFVTEQSGIWADKVLAETDLTDQQRIEMMVQQAHGVTPAPDQTAEFQRFLTQQAEVYGAVDRRAWSDLGHALLNMKAFYFLR